MNEDVIDIKNLVKKFGSFKALDSLELTVTKGGCGQKKLMAKQSHC